ncbi:hypothetical protein PY479_12825 [Shewanella sp. A32]|nr:MULTISPECIES: hypothetical protein [Shewanella]MDF0535156.1 hypothetical protein [Shewanella sp. A32]
MSKEHNSSKEQKKKPQLSMKEKRAAKAAKRQARNNPVDNS